jgi:hypothetical protein
MDRNRPTEMDSINNQIQNDTAEKLCKVADKLQELSDTTVTVSRDYIKISELSQFISQELTDHQTSSNERNSSMVSFQDKQQAIQTDLAKLKHSLEEVQDMSTDGTLTWRVDNVAEHMANAQSERVPSICSPVFYSSRTGYKMRVRLYLCGDGNARRTHISVFFLLMKGEFDAILPWPFNYKVTFCLFNQLDSKAHVVDTFRPDTKSSSFQRPKTESNIASGIPKFFPLPLIQQDSNPYVLEDTMFFRIIVDNNEILTNILPFILSLNPGLPYHVQQNQINDEQANQSLQTTNDTL